ncbi:hypothetical protein [Streptomyces sp. MBT84]|uniref:hypothetical protein n=1 Tax=Streptomyces sp. MBT84 TaxID=1488414 RepID=UPI002076685C|nr:hypothetical protein [Streptomyces sp. MBT84]
MPRSPRRTTSSSGIQPGDAIRLGAYFDEPKLIVDTGIAHGRLGEAATAEPLIATHLRRETAPNQRGHAFTRSGWPAPSFSKES